MLSNVIPCRHPLKGCVYMGDNNTMMKVLRKIPSTVIFKGRRKRMTTKMIVTDLKKKHLLLDKQLILSYN